MPRDPLTGAITPFQTTVIPLPDTLAYETYVKNATGKILLACYWPEDKTSRLLIAALNKRMPQIESLGVVGVYSVDVYSLPKIAEELDVTFCPTLMWFNDRVQDSLVWHDGVRIAGEKTFEGVERVLQRIAEAGLAEDESGDEAWDGMGGIYHGVGSSSTTTATKTATTTSGTKRPAGTSKASSIKSREMKAKETKAKETKGRVLKGLESDDDDEAWDGMGGIYHGVGTTR